MSCARSATRGQPLARSPRPPASRKGRSTATSPTSRPCSSRPSWRGTPRSWSGPRACPERAGTATVASNLVDCLQRLSELRDDLLPLELALLTDPELAALRPAGLAAPHEGVPVGPPEFVARYLAAEQGLGRVRPDVDPERMAVVLLVTLFGLSLRPPPRDGAPTRSCSARPLSCSSKGSRRGTGGGANLQRPSRGPGCRRPRLRPLRPAADPARRMPARARGAAPRPRGRAARRRPGPRTTTWRGPRQADAGLVRAEADGVAAHRGEGAHRGRARQRREPDDQLALLARDRGDPGVLGGEAQLHDLEQPEDRLRRRPEAIDQLLAERGQLAGGPSPGRGAGTARASGRSRGRSRRAGGRPRAGPRPRPARSITGGRPSNSAFCSSTASARRRV